MLASPHEKSLEPGEILVTVATEPPWTPVFVNASGVVLEVGAGLQMALLSLVNMVFPVSVGYQELRT